MGPGPTTGANAIPGDETQHGHDENRRQDGQGFGIGQDGQGESSGQDGQGFGIGQDGQDGQEESSGHEGLAAGPVTEWLVANVADVTPPFRFELIAGGRSNLTFRVDDASGRSLALRRPPVSHVLPTAHDMGREHRLLRALGGTDVPVPRTFGLCDDVIVNGAPFYVMEFVEGYILRNAAEAEAALDVATRGVVGGEMAATLAGLHDVDVDTVGLGDLARRDGYIERQLRRWTGQYEQMQVPGVDHGGLVESVGAALLAQVPAQQGVSIVHGDYRLDNVVLGAGGEVKAILDWEICTLGDPMADVGLLMVYWAEPSDGEPFLGAAAPTCAPGFASRAEVLSRYAAAAPGRDVSGVNYYMAFGYWKLACILQGVFARYVAGAGAGDTGSVDEFPATVRRLAGLAATTLEAN